MVRLDSEMVIGNEENGRRSEDQDWINTKPAWLIAVRKGCWSFILTKLQHALALEMS